MFFRPPRNSDIGEMGCVELRPELGLSMSDPLERER
jgi:hypothetical protein